jgi:UMF1 family MFS transporter
MGIQLIAMFGAWFFAKLSGKIGNIRAMILSVIVWIMVCFYAYTIKHAFGFILVATVVGFVMGGSQSLARSTYSKMIPETTDHTSFFSFYDVTEKLATVAGTFSFGFIEAITGSMRYSVLAITIFFAIGLVFLMLLLFSGGSRIKFKSSPAVFSNGVQP